MAMTKMTILDGHDICDIFTLLYIHLADKTFPVRRSGSQCSRGVGYYSQLVWQNTTHVGCGWTQFQYRGFPVRCALY